MVRAVSIRNGARREARLRLAKEQRYMSSKPLVSEDVCWHCLQRKGSQAEAVRLERSYKLTSEALDQSQEDLYNALSENEQLRIRNERLEARVKRLEAHLESKSW